MNDVQEIKQRSVWGAVSYTLRTGATYLIALVATALLSAYLSPEEFGVFFIVTAIISFFTFLSDIGLAATLVQKKEAPTLIELRTTFTIQQMLALGIFFLIVLLTPVWQRFTHLETQGLWLLYALGLSFVLASLKTIPSILLERELNFKNLAIPAVIEQLIFYLTVVVMAKNGWGVTSFTIGVLARSIGGVIVIYLIKSWPIGVAWDRQVIRDLLRYGVKFQLNDFLARLKDDLYFIVLARFVPTLYMGYLGWAKRWSMFPYQFSVQNIITITFPTFSRVQEDKQLIARGLEITLYFISLIIFPVLVGMMVLANPLVTVIPHYNKWLPALPYLYLFCINIAFAAIANPFISALNAMGNINTTLKLMVWLTLFTWGLTPFAVVWFSYVGVSIVAVITAVLSLFGYLKIKKIIPVRLFPTMYKQFLMSIVMGGTILFIQRLINPSLLLLAIYVILGGLLYTAGMFFFDRRVLLHHLARLTPQLKWLERKLL